MGTDLVRSEQRKYKQECPNTGVDRLKRDKTCVVDEYRYRCGCTVMGMGTVAITVTLSSLQSCDNIHVKI
jgi:predicted RNA-binding Zn-ribbon protein involved in translation (DUF1610 family)